MRRLWPLGLVGVAACAPAVTTVAPIVAAALSPDETYVSPPDDEGSRFVSVTAGRRVSDGELRRRWKHAAQDACDGEYLVIADDTGERRIAGVVSSRTREGFVRCLLETEAPGEALGTDPPA